MAGSGSALISFVVRIDLRIFRLSGRRRWSARAGRTWRRIWLSGAGRGTGIQPRWQAIRQPRRKPMGFSGVWSPRTVAGESEWPVIWSLAKPSEAADGTQSDAAGIRSGFERDFPAASACDPATLCPGAFGAAARSRALVARSAGDGSAHSARSPAIPPFAFAKQRAAFRFDGGRFGPGESRGESRCCSLIASKR